MTGKLATHWIARITVPLVAVGVLTACGQLSDDTAERSKDVICASTTATIESLRTGGKAGQLMASIVADLATDQKVIDAAEAIADGEGGDKAVDTVASWVNKQCG